jgi:hypothetical protein
MPFLKDVKDTGILDKLAGNIASRRTANKPFTRKESGPFLYYLVKEK